MVNNIKRITFETYEKYFYEQLRHDTTNSTGTALFYRIDDYELVVTFNFTPFIIYFTIGLDKIKEMFQHIKQYDFEVNMEKEILYNDEYSPYIHKFIKRYLYNRGIQEI